MSLHYPPLANGSYRVGDPPQQLPSPVPGPDPSQPCLPTGFPLPPAPQPNRLGPAPSSPPQRPQAGSYVLGFVLVLALALTLGAVSSLVEPGSSSRSSTASRPSAGALPEPPPSLTSRFTAMGELEVSSSQGGTVTGTRTECQLPPTLADLGTQTTVLLLDSERIPLSDTRLRYTSGGPDHCLFSFRLLNVPPGQAFYLLEIPGRGQLRYSEVDLRKGLYLSLGG